MSLIDRLQRIMLTEQQIAMVWLGQAGFLLMDPQRRIIAVDPYLSHCGERIKGFMRVSARLIEPSDFFIDAYLVTHKHFDHLDYDALPTIMRSKKNQNTQILGSASAVREYRALMGTDEMVLLTEERAELWTGAVCRAVFADHGDLDPEAVGIWLDLSGFSIYITGDTAYRPQHMKQLNNSSPDVMIASVNGRFGNLNAQEAAKLAANTGAKSMVPCHFGMFIEHGGEPDKLPRAISEFSPETNLSILTVGEIYLVEKKLDKQKIIFKRESTEV